jgi:hypothetical protein
MKVVIGKSFIFAIISAAAMLTVRGYFHTELYLSDIGGIQTFFGVFGILYGIMAAFIIFEVWNQYNETSGLVDKEAQGLERLYRLTLYFRDKQLTKTMLRAIKNYASGVIEGKFQALGSGKRNVKNGKLFRKIADIIRDIKFDDDHDVVVYDQILTHYGQLGLTRTDRQSKSLQRLPVLLKAFIYVSSGLILTVFIILPFANPIYGVLSAFGLGFVLAMVYQLIEDLDNPFKGQWNITPEPFERALKHIEEDY